MAAPVSAVPFALSFAPDRNPDWNVNAGMLTGLANAYPTKKGSLKGYLASGNVGNASVAGATVNGRVMEGADGTQYCVIGTVGGSDGKLYRYQSNTFFNIGKGGDPYPLATDWQFSIRGDEVLACDKHYLPQKSTISAIGVGSFFVDLAGSPPKAACVCVQKNFVMLANINDGVNDYGDGWACSGIGNSTTWTPDAATQAERGRLTDTPGKIVSLVPMKDFIVAYKRDSITIMDYIGPPNVWGTRTVSHNIGCGAPHGVAVVGDYHYFVHSTGVYRFDGSNLQPIGDDVSTYYLNQAGVGFNYEHAATDEQNGLVFWYGKSAASNTAAFTRALVLNVVTGRAGWVSSPTVAYDMTATIQGTSQQVKGAVLSQIGYSAITDPLNVALIGPAAPICVAGFGPTATTTLTFGYIGADDAYTRMQRITPHCISLASIASGTDTSGERMHNLSVSTTMTVDATRTRLDFDVNARWHQPQITLAGAEILGVSILSSRVGAL